MFKTIANFDEIFEKVIKSNCPNSVCELMRSGCRESFYSDFVVLGSNMEILASETIKTGYDETFCYKCVVEQIGLPK